MNLTQSKFKFLRVPLGIVYAILKNGGSLKITYTALLKYSLNSCKGGKPNRGPCTS